MIADKWFKYYGLSNKETFTEDEYSLLMKQYPEIHTLAVLETGSKPAIEQQISDINDKLAAINISSIQKSLENAIANQSSLTVNLSAYQYQLELIETNISSLYQQYNISHHSRMSIGAL